MAILQIHNVTKQFGNQRIVNQMHLDIQQGEFFTLLGPSGCGKTTLLRMIAGFIKPDSGEILLDGKDITYLPPEKRPLHTIFQSYALFPHLTVFDNVAFPLKMAKWSKEKINSQVKELLEDVQLIPFSSCYPHELSGGQRQRVAIARSLVDRPKILLLDEPLSALDARLREHMHMELVKLQEETGVTFIYVTHDQSEALALSTRIAVMNMGEIQQLNTPQIIYSNPATHFVADFIGKCNLLEAVVLNKVNNTLTLRVADSMEFDLMDTPARDICIGQKGWYAIRPEKICVSRKSFEGDNTAIFTMPVTVSGYYYYGVDTLYTFQLSNGVLLEAMQGNTQGKLPHFFEENEKVQVSFDVQLGKFLTE